MKQWYKNRKKDHFYQLAQKNDLISRAYFKLEEIDKKHQIIKKSSKVLDIGCCPGGCPGRCPGRCPGCCPGVQFRPRGELPLE